MKFWSVEEIGVLREHAALHLTGSQAAKLLSERFGRPFTRSMVNGAAHRHGILLTSQVNAGQANGPRRPKRSKPMAPPAEPVVANVPCTIWELTRQKCHFPLWPHASRAHPSYLFCGAKTARGTPYCEGHCNVVYNTQPERRYPIRLGSRLSSIAYT